MTTDRPVRFGLSVVAVALALWILVVLFVPDPTVTSSWPGVVLAVAALAVGYVFVDRTG